MAEEKEPTATPETANQRQLITHAVLVGLTPLIPVPFVDDLVKSHLLRRMVRGLAASHGRTLVAEDVEALTAERGGGGCLRGCVGQVVVYPLKRIFRKVFFFLEWKRAVDLTSRTYHQGYLIDYALRPARAGVTSAFDAKTAAEVRAAIDDVCRESPVKPLEGAVAATFRKSKNVLRSAASLLEATLRRRSAKPGRKEVAEAVASVAEQEERELAGVTGGLQAAISNIPEEHFRRLRERLDARLSAAPEAIGRR